MCNFQILVKRNEKEAACIKKTYKKKQLNSKTEEDHPLSPPCHHHEYHSHPNTDPRMLSIHCNPHPRDTVKRVTIRQEKNIGG